MENNLENKARFFAQYFGQEIRVWKELPENLCNVGYASLSEEAVKDSKLILKSLTDTSNEHAIEVAKMVFPGLKWEPVKDKNYKLENKKEGRVLYLGTDDSPVRFGRIDAGWFCNNEISVHLMHFKIVDFLRSKGYLLPFNGLSTEEIIERGWAKIKS